jgi:hypothetical protein
VSKRVVAVKEGSEGGASSTGKQVANGDSVGEAFEVNKI